MNILLIGSNGITSELLEYLQKIVDGSVFLATSVKEALHLVRNYSFRFIVLNISSEQDLPIYREIMMHAKQAMQIVCGGDIQQMKKVLENGAATWVPDFETLVTFLEFQEERRYQSQQSR